MDKFPVKSQVSPGYLQEILPKHAPVEPESFQEIMNDVKEKIIPGITHWQSPNFYGYFPAMSSFPGQLGSMLSSMFNVVGFSWIASPALTELETIVLDWLRKLIGLPEEFDSNSPGGGGGVIQGTASESSLVALLAARNRVLSGIQQMPVAESSQKLVIYISDQGHVCFKKSALVAGFNPELIRVIPTSSDDNYAFSTSRLKDAILHDISMGLIPCFLGSTLGTTSSTAFDDICALGDIAKEFGLWHHIDAAYAGSAFICPEYRHLLKGVEKADSFCMNPHKWLATNFECSALWVQERKHVLGALSLTPEYLRNKEHERGYVTDYRDWQVPLGRSFRALKLWFVLRMFGQSRLQAIIRHHCKLAKFFESLILQDSRFEICSPTLLGLVCFRVKASNDFNEKLINSIVDDGEIFLVHTKLEDKFVLRLAMCSPEISEEHLKSVWKIFIQKTEELMTT